MGRHDKGFYARGEKRATPYAIDHYKAILGDLNESVLSSLTAFNIEHGTFNNELEFSRFRYPPYRLTSVCG